MTSAGSVSETLLGFTGTSGLSGVVGVTGSWEVSSGVTGSSHDPLSDGELSRLSAKLFLEPDRSLGTPLDALFGRPLLSSSGPLSAAGDSCASSSFTSTTDSELTLLLTSSALCRLSLASELGLSPPTSLPALLRRSDEPAGEAAGSARASPSLAPSVTLTAGSAAAAGRRCSAGAARSAASSTAESSERGPESGAGTGSEPPNTSAEARRRGPAPASAEGKLRPRGGDPPAVAGLDRAGSALLAGRRTGRARAGRRGAADDGSPGGIEALCSSSVTQDGVLGVSSSAASGGDDFLSSSFTHGGVVFVSSEDGGVFGCSLIQVLRSSCPEVGGVFRWSSFTQDGVLCTSSPEVDTTSLTKVFLSS